jgi:hypothetical protein
LCLNVLTNDLALLIGPEQPYQTARLFGEDCPKRIAVWMSVTVLGNCQRYPQRDFNGLTVRGSFRARLTNGYCIW